MCWDKETDRLHCSLFNNGKKYNYKSDITLNVPFCKLQSSLVPQLLSPQYHNTLLKVYLTWYNQLTIPNYSYHLLSLTKKKLHFVVPMCDCTSESNRRCRGNQWCHMSDLIVTTDCVRCVSRLKNSRALSILHNTTRWSQSDGENGTGQGLACEYYGSIWYNGQVVTVSWCKHMFGMNQWVNQSYSCSLWGIHYDQRHSWAWSM